MERRMNIAIAKDWGDWHGKFAQFLEEYKSQGINFNFSVINIDCVDWQEKVKPFDIVIWNPSYMGIRLANHFKEKVYFMQHILDKLVVPNFNTVWHFESKVAESYLLTQYEINTPRTFVSFDYSDARHEMEQSDMPIVLKKSEGAASQNVELIHNKKRMERVIEDLFWTQLWIKARPWTSKTKYIFNNLTKTWFINWILYRYGLKQIGDGVICWQEYIPGNQADLRITVIGDRFAYGFWRNNRPDDFRASGSGLIDYEREVPKEVINYCLNINNELHFDSMAYDILFTNDSFVINEMSYNYIDKALFNAPGYYEKSINETLSFKNGHYWPQELWIKWLLIKTGCIK